MIMRLELVSVGTGEAARGVERTDIWWRKLQGLRPALTSDMALDLRASVSSSNKWG